MNPSLATFRRAGAVAATLALAASLAASTPRVEAATPYPDLDRIDATDAVSAGVEVSRRLFAAGGAGAVVLARSDTFPDALAASAVAAEYGAPVLFTPSDYLDLASREEIERALPTGGQVFLMGGTVALSQAVEDELRAMGYQTPRFQGATRNETAALAARAIGLGPGNQAILVRSHGGTDDATVGWVDSVSCGAYAANTGTPILLTNPGQQDLHPANAAVIEDLDVQRVIVCGGIAAVPQEHADQAAAAGALVERYAGAQRVETAVEVAKGLWGYTGQAANGKSFIAVPGWEQNFAFGLAAAPLAAARDAAILLVGGNEPTDVANSCTGSGEASRATLCYLTSEYGTGGSAGSLTVAGSTSVVSDAVATALADAARLPRVSGQIPDHPFGVFFNPRVFGIQERVDLAQTLHTASLRTYPVLVKTWDGQCPECEAVRQAGLDFVLTIRNSADVTEAATPPEDLAVYQATVGRIIDAYRPALAVIENEEEMEEYYTGSAQDYAAQLQAACAAAHQRNVACANGGLVSSTVVYTVYQHYVDTGQTAKAESFADRAFASWQQERRASPGGADYIRTIAERVRAFLATYQGAGADYVNFHWYVADGPALHETVAFLEDFTGLPAVTNEVGQHDLDPVTTTGVLRALDELNLPYAVWFSSDSRLAQALVNDDGTLRPTGEAFRDFIAANVS